MRAVTIGHCKIYGEDAVLGICDARFLMSSMGHVMGRKLPALWNARQRKVCRSSCFAAPVAPECRRGSFPLMQMAKTSAALKRHSEAGLLYIPVLTDPTTGGVTASFAMLETSSWRSRGH